MPVFNKRRRYVNSKGQKFGKGVWYDDKGKMIKPGKVAFNRTNRTVTQYNTDGTITTFPWEEYTRKKTEDYELQVLQNDRKYAIPVIKDKMMTISIDKNSPTRRNANATFSENVLDSIAVNAKKAGLPFSTALGLASAESTISQGKRGAGVSPMPWMRVLNSYNSNRKKDGTAITYNGYYSPTTMISNWKQRDENPYHDYYYNEKGTLLETPRDDDYYEKDIYSKVFRSNREEFNDMSPLEQGFRKYKEDPTKWNPGDKDYWKKVETNKQELVNYSPEIRNYMKKNDLHSRGGSLSNSWDNLSLSGKSEIIKVAISNGIITLPEIKEAYNKFAEGGPENTKIKIVDQKGDQWYPTTDENDTVYYRNDYAVAPTDSLTLDDVDVYGRTPSMWDRVMSRLRPVIENYYADKDSYSNAVTPFNFGDNATNGNTRDNIINVANGVAGQRDRLEMLGMVKDENGYHYKNPYYIPNAKNNEELRDIAFTFGFNSDDHNTWSKYLKWCAENANTMNRSPLIQRPTIGDAWTRTGLYGDSLIVGNPDIKKEDYWQNGIGQRLYNRDKANYVKDHIDESDLHTGDIVDIVHSGSDFTDEAFKAKDGRGNSHTGNILRVGPNKEDTYVVHYQGNGHVEVEPIGPMIGPGLFKKNYITGIRRPNKKHSLGGNLFDDGGDWKPSKEAINRLYGYEGISMTQSYKDPLSGKWVGPNNSIENETKAFISAIPESIRYKVLANPELADYLFSYSYNVGAGNFRGRVVPVLERYYNGESTVDDITNSMWASGDKKLKGLQKRRAEERQGVRNALLANNNSINNPLSSSPLYDESIFSYKAPVIDETMFASTPKVEEVVYDPMQEQRENLQRFASVMAMMNNGEEDSPYLNALNMASNPLMTIANINS